MKRLVLTLTAAAVIATGGVATAYAVQSDDKPATSPTTGVPTGSLTAAKAAEQAVKDVPGGVVTDVDWDDSKWELDVHTTAGWRELSYDANGKLLSNRPDTHSDDRGDDRGNDSTDDHHDDKGGDDN
ncbi:hypothetical protein GCM10009745_58370 [Kribbella yunnanensis]|uniref:PepSY domain-containing protein n=1 Tax=Kribbella yunnanensis TaxID=190194 RepID=A0ABP4UHT3_9ACTN